VSCPFFSYSQKCTWQVPHWRKTGCGSSGKETGVGGYILIINCPRQNIFEAIGDHLTRRREWDGKWRGIWHQAPSFMTVVKHKSVGAQYKKYMPLTTYVWLFILAVIWLVNCVTWLKHICWMIVYLLFGEILGWCVPCPLGMEYEIVSQIPLGNICEVTSAGKGSPDLHCFVNLVQGPW
jgi:hypothetical protein